MSREAVIVGAGIVGLCCAHEAVRRGWRVTVVDRGQPEDPSCSSGNAGMVVPSHFIPLAAPGMVTLGLKWMWNPESPFYIKPRIDPALARWGWLFMRAATAKRVARAAPVLRDMHLASRAAYLDLAREHGNDFGLVEHGLVMLCRTERGLAEEEEAGAKARELGVPAEVVNPEQLARMEPRLKMNVAGGVIYPKDCHLSPLRFLEAMRRVLREAGVQFRWGRQVDGWKVEGARIIAVETGDEPVEGDAFVLAGGAWSMHLGSKLGIDLPMQAGKGYSVTLENPPARPGICGILTEARVAFTPIGETLRFGGTMEIGGLDGAVSRRRVEGIAKAVPRYFPQFSRDDLMDKPVWRGLRPCAPDGMPYLGRSAAVSNLVVATGHAMMGVSLAPVTGRLVGQVLDGEPTDIPLDLVAPDRFRRGRAAPSSSTTSTTSTP